jgi:hypothetical protein
MLLPLSLLLLLISFYCVIGSDTDAPPRSTHDAVAEMQDFTLPEVTFNETYQGGEDLPYPPVKMEHHDSMWVKKDEGFWSGIFGWIKSIRQYLSDLWNSWSGDNEDKKPSKGKNTKKSKGKKQQDKYEPEPSW